jgi:hypothetical protein
MVGEKSRLDEMPKNTLCQDKMAFKNPIAVNDSELEKGNNMVRISFVSDGILM